MEVEHSIHETCCLVDICHGDIVLVLALVLDGIGLGALALEQSLAVRVEVQLGDLTVGRVDAEHDRRTCTQNTILLPFHHETTPSNQHEYAKDTLNHTLHHTGDPHLPQPTPYMPLSNPS